MKGSRSLSKIVIGLLVCVALAFVIFNKNPNVKAGVICLCFGLATLFGCLIVRQNSEKELQSFDIESKEILIDIANNGANSIYFGVYDIGVLNKLRAKLVKRNHKQLISCAILSVILIISAFICFG